MKICPQCSQSHDSPVWICPACGWEPEIKNGIICLHPAISNAVHYPEENFSNFAECVDRHFWSTARDSLLLWALKRRVWLPNARNGKGSVRFLEVGCGLGQFIPKVLNKFPRWSCTGVEYYSEPLQIAKLRAPEAEFIQLNAVRMPYQDEFDIIGMFDVLEHIEADVPFLVGCVRALKASGYLLIQVPQHPWLWSDFDIALGHQRRYLRSELFNKARSVGLEPVWSSSFVLFLLPAMCLSRLFGKDKSSQLIVSDQLILPTWQNTFCGWVMALERIAIRGGIRFPAGGSLLAVFRRTQK